MPFGPISEPETDPFAPLKSSLFKRLANNLLFALSGGVGAPVNRYGWHPYDMLNVGDGADGEIYDFATDGVQSTVTSPNFADDYEYRFIFEGVSVTGGISGDLRMALYRETSAGYSGPVLISESGGVSSRNFGILEMQSVRRSLQSHIVASTVSSVVLTGQEGPATAGAFYYTHPTAQKILRARFDFLSGDFGSGKIIMQRRLAVV